MEATFSPVTGKSGCDVSIARSVERSVSGLRGSERRSPASPIANLQVIYGIDILARFFKKPGAAALGGHPFEAGGGQIIPGFKKLNFFNLPGDFDQLPQLLAIDEGLIGSNRLSMYSDHLSSTSPPDLSQLYHDGPHRGVKR